MPLSSKGKKIKDRMQSPVSKGGYGAKEGGRIFYASKQKGTIKGVHRPKKQK